jgi:hypothetical protein
MSKSNWFCHPRVSTRSPHPPGPPTVLDRDIKKNDTGTPPPAARWALSARREPAAAMVLAGPALADTGFTRCGGDRHPALAVGCLHESAICTRARPATFGAIPSHSSFLMRRRRWKSIDRQQSLLATACLGARGNKPEWCGGVLLLAW